MSMTIPQRLRIFQLPIGVALLAWPLVGAVGAVRFGVAALLMAVIYRVARNPVITDALRAFSASAARLSAHFSRSIKSIRTASLLALTATAVFLLPLFLNDYSRDIMTLTLIYVVLALGLSIMVGQAGLLNLGYVAFYAVGAYSYAVLSRAFNLGFWPGLLVGGSSAVLYSLMIGIPTLKLRGDYFAIVTLGLGEITRLVLNNWDAVTGGPNGIANVNRPMLFGYQLRSTMDFCYLVLIVAVGAIFVVHRLKGSRIGRAWAAIREDETAAEAMGLDTFRLKLLALMAGAFLAGITGVIFAAKMAFVSPESFTFFESVLVLCMVVLGGMGNITGIVIAAFLLIALPEAFRDFQDYRMLAFGVALVLLMIFRPQGMSGIQARRG